MIIGQAGSGKSTLARRLGEALDLPVFHIDRIHWKPGWVEREGKEKDLLCADVHAKDTWVFEGGRSVTWPDRLNRADTLIWLDFPFSVRVWRAFKRRVKYSGKTRPDLPSNCPEQLSAKFVKFFWNTRHTQRQMMRQFFHSAPEEKEKYRLSNRMEVEQLVETLVR